MISFLRKLLTLLIHCILDSSGVMRTRLEHQEDELENGIKKFMKSYLRGREFNAAETSDNNNKLMKAIV